MWWRVTFIAGALLAAVVPVPPALVERAYSVSAYRALQRPVTSLSNLVPFALFDALIVVALSFWIGAAAVDIARRAGWPRVIGRALLRTAVMASALYLAFLVVWGLNYRRVRLADKLEFDETAVSQDTAVSAAATTIGQLNALYDEAHRAGWPPPGVIDPDLAAAFARTDRAFGSLPAAVVARPKGTLLDLYFRRVGVEGMTNPYFLETLVQRELLPFERPFVVAHEWSHLAGFADESEANFVGWLTCLRAPVASQYSGWLFLFGELSRAVRPRDWARVSARLQPGPRGDLSAMADRYRRQVSPRASAAGWTVYDRYLKANRVEAGTASYGQVVRLVLGARYGPDWTPRLKH